jgi:K+-transporting ATPase ATPase A chain
MTGIGLFQLAIYMVVLIVLAKPLGTYMANVYEGKSAVNRILGPVERFIYRWFGTREDIEMNWKTYTLAFLVFNLIGLLVVYVLQRAQTSLPLNQGTAFLTTPVTADSAFNTAVSFASNTNWQGYGGETTMTYLTQMLGLTVQNFVSAAGGMAVLVALIRGLARRSAHTLGNFWVDLTRSTLYILMPLSIILAMVLVSQGVVQTFNSYATAQVVDKTALTDTNGSPVTEQTIAVGPAASVRYSHLKQQKICSLYK